MITRYGAPSKLDMAPIGTFCKVSIPGNKVEIYRQISNDEDCPNWIFIGEYPDSVTDADLHTAA